MHIQVKNTCGRQNRRKYSSCHFRCSKIQSLFDPSFDGSGWSDFCLRNNCFFSVPLEMGCASKQKGSVFQKELKSSEVNTQNQARTKTTNQVFHDPGREVWGVLVSHEVWGDGFAWSGAFVPGAFNTYYILHYMSS